MKHEDDGDGYADLGHSEYKQVHVNLECCPVVLALI